MKKSSKYAIFLAELFILAIGAWWFFSPETNVECGRSESHPGYPITKPLSERFHEMPQFVLKQLMDWDHEVYEAESWTPDRRHSFMNAVNLLPPALRSILEKKLHDIYLVSENFQGMGLTYMTLNANDELSNLMVLNVKIFEYSTIDEWLTRKEQSNFKTNDAHSVRWKTGTILPALFGLLLHESAHVVDFNLVITSVGLSKPHADWIARRKIIPKRGVWMDIYRQPLLPFENDLTFYGMDGGKKMLTSDMPKVYVQLFERPFASLYSAKYACEDFAELCLFGYLSKKYKAEPRLILLDNGHVIKEWSPLSHPRIAERIDDIARYAYPNE